MFQHAFGVPCPIDVAEHVLWMDVKETVRNKMNEGESQFHLKGEDASVDISLNGYERGLEVVVPNDKGGANNNDTCGDVAFIKEIKGQSILYITLSDSSIGCSPAGKVGADGCVICLRFPNTKPTVDILEKIIRFTQELRPLPVLGCIILEEKDDSVSDEIDVDSSLFQ